MSRNTLLGSVFGSEIERTERLCGPPPERPDELAVIGVGDLARAMVELELLQCRERAVTFLRQAQAAPFELVRRDEPVVGGRGLAQKRQPDGDGARDREQRADDEREGQIRTAASA
jgi:hypothetical protein